MDTNARVLKAYSQYLDMDGDKYYNTTYGSLTCNKYASIDTSKLILTSESLGADLNDQIYSLGTISSCGTYDGSNGEYVLANDIRIPNGFNGSCVIFTGSNVSFDMKNLSISVSDSYQHVRTYVN
jgi:hypothetical protein